MKYLLILFAILSAIGCSSDFTDNEIHNIKTDIPPVVKDSTDSSAIKDSISNWKPGKGGTVNFGEGKDIQ